MTVERAVAVSLFMRCWLNLCPQKMRIWVCKIIRIATVRVWMSMDEQTFPGDGISGAVSRPGAAARRRIIFRFLQILSKFGTRLFSVIKSIIGRFSDRK